MLRKSRKASKTASPRTGAKRASAEPAADCLDPRGSVEIIASSSGTTNDPAGTDRTPPCPTGTTPP